MASLIQRKPGYFAVQFTLGRSRPIVYLGKIARRTGEVIRSHIENILAAKISGQAMAASTAAWLNETDLYPKLVKVKLVPAREDAAVVTLGKFLDGYIKGRTDLKPRTLENLKQVRNGLVVHFGQSWDLRQINKGNMGDWHRWLKGKNLSRATIAMHVKKARQFFADAVDRKLISENPVKGIKAGGMSNPDRFHYVPLTEIAKVIDACPSIDWKLIFALARYAALRTPSETYALRWADIDWAKSRMTVRASKTEHHHGGGIRQVPISPLLLPLLREALEQASDGSKYVISTQRTKGPGTGGARILERAGVVQWPKLFQNLRSSCETDWTAFFPLHVACAWAGNSELVAKRHYLQTTDEHFEAAAKGAAHSAASTGESDEKTPAVIRNHVSGVYVLPPREAHRNRFRGQYRGIPRKVLRHALRQLKAASPFLYQYAARDIRLGGRS